jgi:hypothetical protein
VAQEIWDFHILSIAIMECQMNLIFLQDREWNQAADLQAADLQAADLLQEDNLFMFMVHPPGFEPGASAFAGLRSIP